MSEKDKQELESVAKHWDDLAHAELRVSPWNTSDTRFPRAAMFRSTAESIRIQIRTGVPVCVCCFKPYGYGVQREPPLYAMKKFIL